MVSTASVLPSDLADHSPEQLADPRADRILYDLATVAKSIL